MKLRRSLLHRQFALAVFAFGIITAAQPATFLVTTTTDSNDGACTVALCSLRDAVIAANANAGADTITLPAGTYTLTLVGANEDAAATGDLDITGTVTINGAGAATTEERAERDILRDPVEPEQRDDRGRHRHRYDHQ